MERAKLLLTKTWGARSSAEATVSRGDHCLKTRGEGAGVVDLFEMIDIADAYGQYLSMTTGSGQLFVEMIKDGAAVEHAGHRNVAGLVSQGFAAFNQRRLHFDHVNSPHDRIHDKSRHCLCRDSSLLPTAGLEHDDHTGLCRLFALNDIQVIAPEAEGPARKS